MDARENQACFVVATANDISQLPPEFLRKGRFDEIFFVDLPTKEERKEILRIHLSKNNQTSIHELDCLADATRLFNGAEIEEVVKESMFWPILIILLIRLLTLAILK